MIDSIELFSGAGGLAKGLELAGANHVAFVEWNTNACKTLRKNYNPNIVFEGDARDFNFDKYKGVQLIAGGPPCQPFSLGGKSKGMDDSRDMFPIAISAIKQTTPEAFIFENVKGLLRNSFTEYFNFIIHQLKYPEYRFKSVDWRLKQAELIDDVSNGKYNGIEYDVKYKLINAADYGIPQKRERVIIVGFRKDLNVDWKFPEATHSEDSLLWEKYVTENYWQRHGTVEIDVPKQQAIVLKHKLLEKYGMIPPELLPWQTIRDAISDMCDNDGLDSDSLKQLNGAKGYPGHTGSSIDEPSKTIKAGAHGVPGGENMIKFNDGTYRYLSVAEAKRIQTFPDEYSIEGAWTEAMRQLGNAVPVKLANIIASSVINKLKEKRQTPL